MSTIKITINYSKIILILLSAIILTVGMSRPLLASNVEDSLLIERLYKLSMSEKQIVIDSLIRADINELFRLEKSAKFREAGSPLICKRIWPERFVNADMQSKILVIDSMFADQSINFDFIGDILSTDKYKDHFPSDEAFMDYRTKLALKTGRLHRLRHARKVLLNYYHGGNKERAFVRPSEQDLLSEGGRYLSGIDDSAGTQWSLICSWPYPDQRYNLWLINNTPDSASWNGLWFTGMSIQPSQDSIAIMKFFGDLPYLMNKEDEMYQLISPRYLTRDLDHDGFYDVEELSFGTDPYRYDTDGDGMADGIDINPLAAGVKNPSDEDLATAAVIRLFAKQNKFVNIYVLFGIFNPQMEYYTDSPNAMFLPARKPWNEWRFNENSGGIPIFVSRHQASDSLIIVFAESKEEKYLYRLEKNDGDWIITLGGPKHPTKNTIIGFNGNIYDP